MRPSQITMTKNRSQAKIVLYGSVIIAIVALTLPISLRLNAIQHELWNMSHAIGFAFLFALLPRAFAFFDRLSVTHYYIVALCIAAIIAFTTETIQHFIPGRSISYVDMYLDVVGAFLGCSIHYLVKGYQRKWYGFLLTLGIFASLYPSHQVFIDEYVMRAQFPVLSNFTYQSELRRWNGENNKVLCVGPTFAAAPIPTELADKYKYEEYAFTPQTHMLFSNILVPPSSDMECGLVVPITNKKYSDTVLRHVPANWEAFKSLSITLYAVEASSLVIRVHDNEHQQSYDYHDRFSQNIVLQPGMNTVEIALNTVKNTPQTREMNLREISAVGIVSIKPHVLKSFVVFSVELQ